MFIFYSISCQSIPLMLHTEPLNPYIHIYLSAFKHKSLGLKIWFKGPDDKEFQKFSVFILLTTALVLVSPHFCL